MKPNLVAWAVASLMIGNVAAVFTSAMYGLLLGGVVVHLVAGGVAIGLVRRGLRAS
jgi:hypothetical protein